MRKVYWNKPKETSEALKMFLIDEAKCTVNDASKLIKSFIRMEMMHAENCLGKEFYPEIKTMKDLVWKDKIDLFSIFLIINIILKLHDN